MKRKNGQTGTHRKLVPHDATSYFVFFHHFYFLSTHQNKNIFDFQIRIKKYLLERKS